MNGESQIGFSLHRCSAPLDGGLLYFVKEIDIDSEQTYVDVHNTMTETIIADTPKVLYDIVNGANSGMVQSRKELSIARNLLLLWAIFLDL